MITIITCLLAFALALPENAAGASRRLLFLDLIGSQPSEPSEPASPVVLKAYWDLKSCGPDGDDANWEVCNERDFECPDVVKSSDCPTGRAIKYRQLGTGASQSVRIDFCDYWYYTEYICEPTGHGCANDKVTCPDGSIVGRDHMNNCRFGDCPFQASNFDLEVWHLVNQKRAQGHITCHDGTRYSPNPRKTVFDCRLWRTAFDHSDDMAEHNFFDHERNGMRVGSRAKEHGIIASGENLASGQRTAEKVVNDWLASTTGHCNRLMDPAHTMYGIARVDFKLLISSRIRWTLVTAADSQLPPDHSCLFDTNGAMEGEPCEGIDGRTGKAFPSCLVGLGLSCQRTAESSSCVKTCSLKGEDRSRRPLPCCDGLHEVTAPRAPSDPHFCRGTNDAHGKTCWSTIDTCRVTRPKLRSKTGKCPAGYVPITDEAECRTLAGETISVAGDPSSKETIKNFNAADCRPKWPSSNTCFTFQAEAYFVNRDCGQTHRKEDHPIVCKPFENQCASSFFHMRNAAIRGHNREQLTDVTVEDCQAACCLRDWCKSFDYFKHQQKCDLSERIALEVGGLKTDWSGNPFDHYSSTAFEDQCTTPFFRTRNAAIRGHNREQLTDVTVEDCRVQCCVREWCKSFDYFKNEQKCDLSDHTEHEAGGLKTDWSGNPFDHYSTVSSSDAFDCDVVEKQMDCKEDCPAGWEHFRTDSHGCCASFLSCGGNRKWCRRKFCEYVPQCSQFFYTRNAAIRGHNREQLTDVTVEDCRAQCCVRDWCKSFDYYKNEQKCDLSDHTEHEVGGLKTDYSGNPYDHYSTVSSDESYVLGATGQTCTEVCTGFGKTCSKDLSGVTIDTFQGLLHAAGLGTCRDDAGCDRQGTWFANDQPAFVATGMGDVNEQCCLGHKNIPTTGVDCDASFATVKRVCKCEDSYLLLQRGRECQSMDTNLGKFATVNECADAVRNVGGTYFIYGTMTKAGKCYVEHTDSDDCVEGWEADEYNFYKIPSEN